MEIDPRNWRPNRRQESLRIRVERVHVESSRRYDGVWVWVEGIAQAGVAASAYCRVLIRSEAIPGECRDRRYRPPSAYTVDPAELRPGNLVRVGRQSAGDVRHTFNMRITAVGEPQPDGRVLLTGYRLTPAGRKAAHTSMRVPLENLFPVNLA